MKAILLLLIAIFFSLTSVYSQTNEAIVNDSRTEMDKKRAAPMLEAVVLEVRELNPVPQERRTIVNHSSTEIRKVHFNLMADQLSEGPSTSKEIERAQIIKGNSKTRTNGKTRVTSPRLIATKIENR